MSKVLYLIVFIFFSQLLIAQDEEIWVSDAGNGGRGGPYQILRFDMNGENGEVFTSTNLNWPQDIIFLEDEHEVLISNLLSNNITKYNLITGDYKGVFALVPGGPTRMELRGDTIFITLWNRGHVVAYNKSGSFLGTVTNKVTGTAIGLTWTQNSEMLVSGFGRPAIMGRPPIPTVVRKFNATGEYIGDFIPEDELTGPTNIWVDPVNDSDILVAEFYNPNGENSIKRYDQNGNYKGVYISNLAGPEGFAYNEKGELLIGNGGTSSVKRFTPEGEFIDDIISSGRLSLLTPNAIKIRNTTIVPIENHSLNEFNLSIQNNFISVIHDHEHIKLMRLMDINGAVRVITTLSSIDIGKLERGVYIVQVIMDDGRVMIDKFLKN